MHEIQFSCAWSSFYLLAACFSRALGCVAHRGTACTLRCKFVPRPRPGALARALGVQRRASWLFFTGLLSVTPSPGPGKYRNFSNIHSVPLLYHTVPPALELSTLRSRDTTAVAHQSLAFVTATDGASVCACLCHDYCNPTKKERTHTFFKIGAVAETGRFETTLRRNYKNNRAATIHTTNDSSRTTVVQPQ